MRGSLETKMCKEHNPQIKIADPYNGFYIIFYILSEMEN